MDRKVIWERRKKEKVLDGDNQKILNDFLKDFELGINVPMNCKGMRTAGTLLKLRSAVVFISNQIPNKNLRDISKEDLHIVFKKMYEGSITKQNGQPFKDVGDYIKNLKTFYSWMLRTGRIKLNVAEDLSRSEYSKGKPAWVYLEHEKLKKIIDTARGDYRALLLFLYDSGIRPSEAYGIKVLDFHDDFKLLTIPEKRADGERVSKTFERTIKLMHSSELLKNYVSLNNLQPEDKLIIPNQPAFNKYLKQHTLKLFSNKLTKARGKLNEIKLTDIRHNAVCYWLDRYRTNKDLMYRFGWKKEDKVFYYSEFLGKRDNIGDDDMITKEDKTELEKRIDLISKENEVLKKEIEERNKAADEGLNELQGLKEGFEELQKLVKQLSQKK